MYNRQIVFIAQLIFFIVFIVFAFLSLYLYCKWTIRIARSEEKLNELKKTPKTVKIYATFIKNINNQITPQIARLFRKENNNLWC